MIYLNSKFGLSIEEIGNTMWISYLMAAAGGILGGISSGEDIYFNVAFKPTATIMKDQDSVNAAGEAVTVSGKGRHDPCVLLRAVPIVEAMAALVLVDFYLRAKADK